jgi:undecaprenyl-phosphate 4-deoxy-4-formamido-L-arabinose transferase
MQGVSIIIPVFRSDESLRQVVERTINHMLSLERDFEIILVDDGSGNDTWFVVEELVSVFSQVRGKRLGRNFGQHSAILAGVRGAIFPLIVTLDDDLQNPPEEIEKLISILDESPRVDVVYGVPKLSAQPLWRRKSGEWIRKFLARTMGIGEAAKLSSFRAFRTKLRDGFSVRLGPGVSIDALLAWSTNSFEATTVDHKDRVFGESHYSVRKLLRFAIDTLTGYSTLPLRLTSILGLLTVTVGLLLLLLFVLLPFFRGVSIQGFPFLASTIILFSGIQLISLGVIGEYLARMHFRVMQKPEYFIMEESAD